MKKQLQNSADVLIDTICDILNRNNDVVIRENKDEVVIMESSRRIKTKIKK